LGKKEEGRYSCSTQLEVLQAAAATLHAFNPVYEELEIGALVMTAG